MSGFQYHRLGGWILLLLLLVGSGCAVRETRPEGAWLQERENWFTNHPRWSVKGRLGLSNGEQGGSLSFDWRADGDHHVVNLRTVAGGKRWRLEFGPVTATLEGSDIGRLRGPDPDTLVEQAVGWPIPVRWMSDWLRGLPAPEGARMTFGPDGALAHLNYQSWSIDFARWALAEHGVLLPGRIEARDPPYRVRAALSGWRFESDQDL